jgi:hypothetical protein
MALTEEQLRAFVPRNFFLKEPYNVIVPEGEEEVTTSYGIPNTDAFTNSGDGGGGGTFEPYTAQQSGDFVTNRTNFGNTGYIRGAEPEENYMNKIGGMIKSGIGMAIPGGNFLMGLAEDQARGNRLSATDNAFIDRQLGIQEENIHGFGNIANQDRYGYNKESMFGNYAALVSKHAKKAKNKNKEDLTNFDNYYLEKQKELEDSKKEVEFNDWMNQRITANKLREQEALGIKTSYKPDIHGGGEDTSTITDQSGKPDGDGGTSEGWSDSWSGYEGNPHGEFNQGGRVYLNLGGLASMLGREGFADGGLDWDEGGDTPMPGGGHGSGHEDAVAAMGGNNEPPTDNLNISPFVNTVDGAPVELGAVSNTKLGRLKAMIGFKNLNEALTYGKGDNTVINSLSDIKDLLDPSLSLNTQIGPVDVNAYKDKDIDSYGLRTNIGPVNLGYQDLNNQKKADISYAPNDKFNIGATTDFDNINFGATWQPNNWLTLGGGINNQGQGDVGFKISKTWGGQDGGLARLL